MSNKESFTFSDKLRKSKSVPLSKRLPSIVGGQSKQKRTLVQRAQRDLPFILAAAFALLLLPFLSRTGGKEIVDPSGVKWGVEEPQPSYLGEGGVNDVLPGDYFQDPIDNILLPVKEAPAPVLGEAKDAYQGKADDRSPYNKYNRYNNEDPYTRAKPQNYDDVYNKNKKSPAATGTFGSKTKAKVRQAPDVARTKVNTNFKTSSIKSSGGMSIKHDWVFGQAPKRNPSNYIDPGVRPVALQRMESKFQPGRGITGENLYASASRSIGEMNRGGSAKANLLAAQMKDVDGKVSPTSGFAGGPARSAGGQKPGGGGRPNNTNGYSFDKPWWWSMMETRSQKMWDLKYYEPRKIWYTNMYNYASQLMNCLFTGNKDGDVSTMFGKSAGDDDLKCTTADILTYREFMEITGAKKTTSGKDTKETETYDGGDAAQLWFKQCPNKPDGSKGWEKKPGTSKNLFKVRAECVGLDVFIDWIKDITKAKTYTGNCSKVHNDPLQFTYSVTKNDKEKERLQNKVVIALVAKVKDNTKTTKKTVSTSIRPKGDVIDGKFDLDEEVTKIEKEVKTDQTEAEKRHHRREKIVDPTYSTKGQEVVIFAKSGNELSMSWDEIYKLYDKKYCELTKLVAFIPGGTTKNAINRALNQANYNKDVFNAKEARKKRKNPDYVEKNFEDQSLNNFWRFRGQIDAARNICLGGDTSPQRVPPLTLDGIYDIAEFVSDRIISPKKARSYQECNIYDTEDRPFIKDKYIGEQPCQELARGIPIEMKNNTIISATIAKPNPKWNVFAVVVEEIDGESDAEVMYAGKITSNNCDGNTCKYELETTVLGTKGFNPNSDGTVKTDYNSSTSSRSTTKATNANENERKGSSEVNTILGNNCPEILKQCQQKSGDDYTKCMASYDRCIEKLNSGTYQADTEQSSDGSNQTTAPGRGRVYWILSESKELSVKRGDKFESLELIEETNLVDSMIGSSYCRYRWCHQVGSCDSVAETPKDQCRDGSNVYIAHKLTDPRITDGNQTVYVSTDKYVGNKAELGNIDTIPECRHFCYDSDDNVYELDNNAKGELVDTGKMVGVDNINPYSTIKPCPAFCKYEESVYKALPVGSHPTYYFRISTTPEANVKTNSEMKDCQPMAWYEDKVYLLKDYEINVALPAAGNTAEYPKEIPLQVSEYDTLKKYKEEALKVNSHTYRLFPELLPPQNLEDNLRNECNFRVSFHYDHVHINPSDADYNYKIQDLATKIEACINYVKQLQQTDPARAIVYTVLSFNGYSSKAGQKNCATCNLALSDDRSLYVIQDLANIIGDEVDTTNAEQSVNKGIKGFGGTKSKNNDDLNSSTHRFNFIPKPGRNAVIKFESLPHGGDDATGTGAAGEAEDRFIFITFDGWKNRAEAKATPFMSCNLDESICSGFSNFAFNEQEGEQDPFANPQA